MGMDWLSPNNAQTMCNQQVVIVDSPDKPLIMILGARRRKQVPVISMAKARKSFNKGGIIYI